MRGLYWNVTTGATTAVAPSFSDTSTNRFLGACRRVRMHCTKPSLSQNDRPIGGSFLLSEGTMTFLQAPQKTVLPNLTSTLSQPRRRLCPALQELQVNFLMVTSLFFLPYLQNTLFPQTQVDLLYILDLSQKYYRLLSMIMEMKSMGHYSNKIQLLLHHFPGVNQFAL